MAKFNQLFGVGKGILLERLNITTPLHVAHSVTFKCNLRCNYCGWWDRKYYEMTTKEVKRAMKELAQLGAVSWGFSGGEPLIRKDINELIDYGNKLGFITNLTTNGLLVKNHINSLKKLDLMTVSIDGPEKVHDAIRGKGSFEKAIEAIKLAKNNNINISASVVLSNVNLENDCRGLKELLSIFKQLKCKFLVQPLYSDEHNKDVLTEKKIKLREREFNMALNLIKRFSKKNKLVLMSNSEIEWMRSFYTKHKSWKCYAGKLFCVMMPDGKLHKCNIFENEWQDGLKLGFKKAFRKLNKAKKGCKCYLACYTKYNHLFSLKPDTILNQLSN